MKVEPISALWTTDHRTQRQAGGGIDGGTWLTTRPAAQCTQQPGSLLPCPPGASGLFPRGEQWLYLQWLWSGTKPSVAKLEEVDLVQDQSFDGNYGDLYPLEMIVNLDAFLPKSRVVNSNVNLQTTFWQVFLLKKNQRKIKPQKRNVDANIWTKVSKTLAVFTKNWGEVSFFKLP